VAINGIQQEERGGAEEGADYHTGKAIINQRLENHQRELEKGWKRGPDEPDGRQVRTKAVDGGKSRKGPRHGVTKGVFQLEGQDEGDYDIKAE
jgi:hypothetical protein